MSTLYLISSQKFYSISLWSPQCHLGQNKSDMSSRPLLQGSIFCISTPDPLRPFEIHISPSVHRDNISEAFYPVCEAIFSFYPFPYVQCTFNLYFFLIATINPNTIVFCIIYTPAPLRCCKVFGNWGSACPRDVITTVQHVH